SPDLSLQQLNSSDVTCVELLCTLEGLRPEQVNFTWTKADEKLPHYHSTNMSSMLKLCKPDWWDGVTLTCQASYPHNSTVYRKNITLTCRNTGPENLSCCPTVHVLFFIIIAFIWILSYVFARTAVRSRVASKLRPAGLQHESRSGSQMITTSGLEER
ncbi:hypothetical protein P4O66_005659, partial [Electrophorus voltai]